MQSGATEGFRFEIFEISKESCEAKGKIEEAEAEAEEDPDVVPRTGDWREIGV